MITDRTEEILGISVRGDSFPTKLSRVLVLKNILPFDVVYIMGRPYRITTLVEVITEVKSKVRQWKVGPSKDCIRFNYCEMGINKSIEVIPCIEKLVSKVIKQ